MGGEVGCCKPQSFKEEGHKQIEDAKIVQNADNDDNHNDETNQIKAVKHYDNQFKATPSDRSKISDVSIQKYIDRQNMRPSRLKVESRQPRQKIASSNIAITEINNLEGISRIHENNVAFFRPKIDEHLMKVPYKIIRMSVVPQLEVRIRQFGGEYMNKFEKDETIREGWYLHPRGFYINRILDDLVCVLNDRWYYEGPLQESDGMILPHGFGIMIDFIGFYKGKFQHGKAQGKGNFIEGQTNTVYKGDWEGGRFVHGSVENEEIKFGGDMIPQEERCHGTLFFKEKDTTYKGQFEKGQYGGEFGQYDSPQTFYKGGFYRGRKTGFGHLTEKEIMDRKKKTNKNKRKYKPPEERYGLWEEDEFIREQDPNK